MAGAYSIQARDAAQELTRRADAARAAAHTEGGLHALEPAIGVTSDRSRESVDSATPLQDVISADNGGTVTNHLILFISHAGADAATAKALVRLFEKALKISARNILCTSVDGYRLPGGVNTDEMLRAAVFDATLLVALLTPASLTSQYVLFELGARWGADRPLFPVLANGSTPRDLRAPLGRLNALDAASPNQVRQLVEDVGRALDKALEPSSSFSDELDAVVELAKPR